MTSLAYTHVQSPSAIVTQFNRAGIFLEHSRAVYIPAQYSHPLGLNTPQMVPNLCKFPTEPWFLRGCLILGDGISRSKLKWVSSVCLHPLQQTRLFARPPHRSWWWMPLVNRRDGSCLRKTSATIGFCPLQIIHSGPRNHREFSRFGVIQEIEEGHRSPRREKLRLFRTDWWSPSLSSNTFRFVLPFVGYMRTAWKVLADHLQLDLQYFDGKIGLGNGGKPWESCWILLKFHPCWTNLLAANLRELPWFKRNQFLLVNLLINPSFVAEIPCASLPSLHSMLKCVPFCRWDCFSYVRNPTVLVVK